MQAEPTQGFDPTTLSRNHAHGLLNSLVLPRPIAWVSTVAADGTTNLAPHSYSTVPCLEPPMHLFVSIGDKDTVHNIRETRCYVSNVVDAAHLEAMNVTSAPAPAAISEFDVAGLEPAPSTKVAAPRVASAPAALECELDRIVELGNPGEETFVVFGRVVWIHMAERVVDYRGNADIRELDPVARIGGKGYAYARELTDLERPAWPIVTGPAQG